MRGVGGWRPREEKMPPLFGLCFFVLKVKGQNRDADTMAAIIQPYLCLLGEEEELEACPPKRAINRQAHFDMGQLGEK